MIYHFSYSKHGKFIYGTKYAIGRIFFLKIFQRKVVQTPAGKTTYIHYNFVVAKPLVYLKLTECQNIDRGVMSAEFQRVAEFKRTVSAGC